ncbi:hypothetical protein [Gordonia sp. NPDC003950]
MTSSGPDGVIAREGIIQWHPPGLSLRGHRNAGADIYEEEHR